MQNERENNWNWCYVEVFSILKVSQVKQNDTKLNLFTEVLLFNLFTNIQLNKQIVIC